MIAPIRNLYNVRITDISTMMTVINTNNTSNYWDTYHHFYNTAVTARTTLHSASSRYLFRRLLVSRNRSTEPN